MKINSFYPETLPTASQIEDLLIAIWKRILEVNEIEVDDRFLWLGGNSLKAIQIITEIDKALAISLPINAIFEHDTITKLIGYLQKEKPKSLAPSPKNVAPRKQSSL